MKLCKKITDYLMCFIFSISFILTSFFISIIPIASNNSYYMLQFKRNGIGEHMNYSLEQLEIITKAITNYMFHGAKSMQVVFDGENVFSDQAISHMADVKVLFVGGTILGYISLVLLIISFVYLIIRRNNVKKIFRIIVLSMFALLIIILLSASIYALIDFDSAFTNFHHILFLNPEKFNNAFFPDDDTLINILTLDFFFDVFVQVATRLAAIFISFFIILFSLYGKTYERIKANYFQLVKDK